MNASLREFEYHDIPTLYEICVWTLPFPPEGVYISNYNSSNAYFDTTCVSDTRINIYEPKEFTIYPNPSNDIINLEIGNTTNATIEIYNVIGKLIYSKALYSKFDKIDVSGFSKGIYIVKVMQKRTIYSGKMLLIK